MAILDSFRVNGTDYDLRDNSKIPTQQGSENAGKALVVGGDGAVTLGEAGVPEAVKSALLTCLQNVAWANGDGRIYYDELQRAFGVDIRYYAIDKADFIINGIGPRPYGDIKVVDVRSITNRASMRTLFPCNGGTIVAKSGYEIAVYEFTEYDFGETVNTGGTHYYGNVWPQPESGNPAWVTQYTISNPNCKYIRICFRKTSDADWQASELQSFYGTVFTANLMPEIQLFGDVSYQNGVTLYNTSRESDSKMVIGERSVAARACSGYIPITGGRLRSADPSKYQVCVYQLLDDGSIYPDPDNPHGGSLYAPAWAEEYDLAATQTQCIRIAFKKLDDTDFTVAEMQSMYGTVFTYEEA